MLILSGSNSEGSGPEAREAEPAERPIRVAVSAVHRDQVRRRARPC